MKHVTDKLLYAICLMFALASWLLPSITFDQKIIITLATVLIASVYYAVMLNICHKKLTKELAEATENRSALSLQYEEKQQIIKAYERAVDIMEHELKIVMYTQKIPKFDALAKAIMFLFSNIKRE